MEESEIKSLSEQEYKVSGKTQIRIDTRFAENEFSCVVKYADVEKRRVDFQMKDFEQTSTAITDTLGADLSGAINRLLFQIGGRDELTDILNTPEIAESWAESKPKLLEKYVEVPDFEPLLDNYGDNLKDGQKLLAAIKDKGIYGLFFPRIKSLAMQTMPASYSRTKIFKEFMPDIDLPVTEKLAVRKYGQEIIIDITGELDKENFDYEKYLNLSSQLFGKRIKAEDVSFQSVENYFLSGFDLQYKTGTQHHYFETKGAYFKDDKLQFKVKE